MPVRGQATLMPCVRVIVSHRLSTRRCRSKQMSRRMGSESALTIVADASWPALKVERATTSLTVLGLEPAVATSTSDNAANISRDAPNLRRITVTVGGGERDCYALSLRC